MIDSIVGLIGDVIFWSIAAVIFLSGALVVVLSYLLGRKALDRLLRLVTRTYTVYFSASETIAACGAGELHTWLEAIFRANGVPLRGLDIMYAGGRASVLIRARVRVNTIFKARSALARVREGMLGIEGIQDFYVDGGCDAWPGSPSC